MPQPRELSLAEVKSTVEAFRRAAAMAISAGADGVEIHGGNGYLVHQFLSSNANQRTDAYGMSVPHRTRFAVEVATAVAQEIGADRTGFRISPGNPFNDIVERDTRQIYEHLARELAALDLAYLHVVQGDDEVLLRSLRAIWANVLIVNRRGRPREQIGADVANGMADIASVATFALANPDLVARLQSGAPLNEPDPASFYGGTDHGYTDYPTLSPAAR